VTGKPPPADGEGRGLPEIPAPDPPLIDRDAGIVLRPWRDTPGDVAALVAAWRDPEIAAANPVPTEASAVRAERWIRGWGERARRGVALDLVVAPSEGSDEAVLGEMGLRGIDATARRAELGWWVAPDQRGRGVAAAAVGLLATWALGPPLGLRQVWARIDRANAASARVAQAAGFQRLGTSGRHEIWARAGVHGTASRRG
jgi:RimJ/RimL family protein N-acetyltransferase